VLGFTLALITAVLWGILPLFLMICLQVMDSPTITLYRFFAAALVVGLWLASRGGLPKVSRYPKAVLQLAVGSTVMLVVNYVFNVMGLKYLSPGSVQVLMQIAPFALMMGGIWIYREQFSRLQGGGAVCLLIGLTLFFLISVCLKYSHPRAKTYSALCSLLLLPLPGRVTPCAKKPL
jgi:drug/metabolite transporter (DMT)-like permease